VFTFPHSRDVVPGRVRESVAIAIQYAAASQAVPRLQKPLADLPFGLNYSSTLSWYNVPPLLKKDWSKDKCCG
jgi:hypothetical protein